MKFQRGGKRKKILKMYDKLRFEFQLIQIINLYYFSSAGQMPLIARSPLKG